MSTTANDSYKNVTLAVPRPSSPGAAKGPVLLHSTIPRELPPNHVLLRVSRFGFSANNVTYQALGEVPHFRYFDFHAAPERPELYALVPVWGFATVVASSAPDINPGERVFGYLAPARFLLLPVDPAGTNPFNFYVPRLHLPPDRRPYNQLTRCAQDALYAPQEENLAMIYRPLFWTAFWAEDWLNSVAYSAQTILISSASARTAYCLAFCHFTARRRDAARVVGITSAQNRAYVEGLQLYDAVVVYEDVERALGTAAHGTVVYVDVAGNDELNTRIWKTLDSRVIRSVSLGLTTLSPTASNTYTVPPSGVTHADTVSPHTLSFFFMPEHLAERKKELGTRAIADMQLQAWRALMGACKQWGLPESLQGADAVRAAWARAVKGGGGGGVWSMWDEEEDKVEKARL